MWMALRLFKYASTCDTFYFAAINRIRCASSTIKCPSLLSHSLSHATNIAHKCRLNQP